MNILLTDYCNRSCPYCFAKKRIENSSLDDRWELSLSELEIILGYCHPGIKFPVSLLGGEPTLHTQFTEIVSTIVKRGNGVKIFSNGTTPNLRKLKDAVSLKNISIIINLNSPETYTPEEMNEIKLNCQSLKKTVCFSFNIYRHDFEWDFLREAILSWDINPMIRLGIAQPIQGLFNEFINEEHMKKTSARIVEMAVDLARDGIALGFDCGFRLCDFTDRQLGMLAECAAAFNFVCGPAMDIGQNLEVWRCFPFSGKKGVTLTDFSSLDEIKSYFLEQWSEYDNYGNKPGCSTCKYGKSMRCYKGCLSRTITYQNAKVDI